MRQYLVILALSAFTMSGNSFADHNGGNYNFAAAANYAYQLADIGESYSGAYIYQLSNAANTMHHAATNLFYALKNKSGGGYPLFDHQEGGIEVIHQMVAQVGPLSIRV